MPSFELRASGSESKANSTVISACPPEEEREKGRPVDGEGTDQNTDQC